MIWISKKIRDLPSTSPGLVFPNQGVVRTSPGLVKCTSRRILLGWRNGHTRLNKLQSVLKLPFSRAYYIRFLFPQNSIHPSHGVCFAVDFHRFGV